MKTWPWTDSDMGRTRLALWLQARGLTGKPCLVQTPPHSGDLSDLAPLGAACSSLGSPQCSWAQLDKLSSAVQGKPAIDKKNCFTALPTDKGERIILFCLLPGASVRVIRTSEKKWDRKLEVEAER